MPFKLSVETAPQWVNEHGLNPNSSRLSAVELAGGVSASVIAVTGHAVGVVLKQALPRLKVVDRWEATVERSRSEVAALRLVDRLTPGATPKLLAVDHANHVLALELLPASARNWQQEIEAQRVHSPAGSWAGRTLGIWHHTTAGRPELTKTLERFSAFEELRIKPFYEVVMHRRRDLTSAIAPYAGEVASEKRCFVDGDYAPKNMLLDPSGRYSVLDLEVAHTGNPVFDLGFFLSFVVLSAVRWPRLERDLRLLAQRFNIGYQEEVGEGFAGDGASVTGHTACLMLARTDGLSPATFLDQRARERARRAALVLLRNPERGLWSWT